MEEEFTWKTIALIPKGNGYFRGIGLVEVLWKMMTVILNHRIGTAIVFHEVLHSFRTGRRMGTASINAKLLQYL